MRSEFTDELSAEAREALVGWTPARAQAGPAELLEAVTPILERWSASRARYLPEYRAGTWGPLEADKLIEADGWREVATKGSHRQFKHPTKAGRVTIAGHSSDDLAPGTYNSI